MPREGVVAEVPVIGCYIIQLVESLQGQRPQAGGTTAITTLTFD